MIFGRSLLVAALLAVPCVAAAQDSAVSRGWLLLEGGGRLRGTPIVTRFVALAGGPSARIVVIPTAISDTEYRPARLSHCETASAEIFGVARVMCLDARDRAGASDSAFLAALRGADGVWFFGGDEGRLVDRFVGTPVTAVLREVLQRGGVLGGTSAGAMIMGTYIPSRDSLAVSGFGFLPRTTIAPHYSQRHYEQALRSDRARRPELRGIGIDESTAIVVHGHDFEVIGGGSVTVMDEHVTVLTSGQHFDLTRDPP